MRILLILVIVALSATSATAQQQTPSPAEQALGQKVMQEVQAAVSCSANLISVQADLAKANARIKELEPKPEVEKPK